MGLFQRDENKKQAKHLAALGETAIPMFPRSVTTVLEKLRNPDSSLDEISEALSWDPGLVVRVLKTVNSAAYGMRTAIDDLRHAVHILGPSQIETLVLALAVGDALPKQPALGYQPQRYWFTAARRAAVARELAGRLHPASQAACFTGGLLQDLALPLLTSAHGDDYGQILEVWHASPQSSLEQLESANFGWNHVDVGACVAEAWELPGGVVHAIRGHHATHQEQRRDVDPAVLLVAMLREDPGTPGDEQLIETARDEYALAPDDVCQILADAQSQARELVELLC